jgi:hypothetical protein
MGFLLDTSSTVLCSHGGQAQATAPNPRVTVAGNPTVLASVPWAIAGCPFVTPAAVPMPCVTAMFVAGTTRVLSLGQPLAVSTASAVCVPNGTPLLPVVVQPRVVGM